MFSVSAEDSHMLRLCILSSHTIGPMYGCIEHLSYHYQVFLAGLTFSVTYMCTIDILPEERSLDPYLGQSLSRKKSSFSNNQGE